MELVEDLGAKVIKYSQITEYMNIFLLQYRSRSFFDLRIKQYDSHSLTVSNNQVYSDD